MILNIMPFLFHNLWSNKCYHRLMCYEIYELILIFFYFILNSDDMNWIQLE